MSHTARAIFQLGLPLAVMSSLSASRVHSGGLGYMVAFPGLCVRGTGAELRGFANVRAGKCTVRTNHQGAQAQHCTMRISRTTLHAFFTLQHVCKDVSTLSLRARRCHTYNEPLYRHWRLLAHSVVARVHRSAGLQEVTVQQVSHGSATE